jgi:molybdate transport system substrate-binding protein
VAAAADLGPAFSELGKLFEASTGQRITFSFGASGALSKQLSNGAPFDLFAAANTSFVEQAITAGACDADTKRMYARGSIVLLGKPGLAIDQLAALAEPRIRHIAIANPEHAPYGKAAREALQRAGLWEAVQSKIVLAENVRQAQELADTGNADVAIISHSLVAAGHKGSVVEIDKGLYAPLQQSLAVCHNGKNLNGGKAFAQLIASDQGRKVLERYGFNASAEPSK